MAVTAEQVRRRIAQEGAFVTLQQLYFEGQVNEAWLRKNYHAFFQYTLELVLDARQEMRHLEQVVQRLEAASRQGVHVWSGTAMSPEYGSLNRDLLALIGWTTSLVETAITLQGLNEPAAVPIRIQQLSSALSALYAKRLADGYILAKWSGLFKELAATT